jgi:hypothetical protein
VIRDGRVAGRTLLGAMTRKHTKVPVRQRASWAAEHTRWTSLPYDILPSAVVAMVTYVVTLLTAPKGTPVDKRAVGFPLIAGVLALVATFLVVNAIEFAVRYVQAGPRLRIDEDQRCQGKLIEASKDVTIKGWVRQHLVHRQYHVLFAAAFGSITQSYETRDIDVLVQLKPASDAEVRRVGLRLKKLSRTLLSEFGLPLHLQLFTSDETEALLRFAARAGSVEVLIGDEYWAEASVRSTSPSSGAG